LEYIIIGLEALSVLGILFLAMFKKDYFPAYLKAKAKNTATKEDIENITSIVEDVKQNNKIQFDEIQKKNEVFFDEIKQSKNRFNSKQFELYNELWSSLIDLKISADDLWDSATTSKLKDLSNKVFQAHISIEKSALLIEETHYSKLIHIIQRFKDFGYGKKTLISIRRKTLKQIDEIEIYTNIDSIIENNRNIKENYDDLLNELKSEFVRQIRGTVV
jgi:hypothetical protein